MSCMLNISNREEYPVLEFAIIFKESFGRTYKIDVLYFAYLFLKA